MKHKQYENWILNERQLSGRENAELEAHLQSCQQCRDLQSGWLASKQLIKQAADHHPAPGFAARFQNTMIKQRRTEKIRRHRLSIFSLIVLAFTASAVYLVATGSMMQSITNGITLISDAIMQLTTGLSTLGYWISSLPIAIPLTVGFIFFGFFSALMMVGAFFLWNLRQRERVVNEIKIN